MSEQPENEGFLKLFRKFFGHEFWLEKRTLSKAEAWLWLLYKVRIQEEPGTKLIAGKYITYNKGEYAASLSYLAKKWEWGSTSTVKRFIDYLISEDMITVDTSQGVSVISLVNHQRYNGHLYSFDENPTTPINPLRGGDKRAGSSTSHREPSTSISARDSKLKTLTEALVTYWNECNGTNLKPTAQGRDRQVKARLKTYTEAELKKAIEIRAQDPWVPENNQQSNWDAIFSSDKSTDTWLNRKPQKNKKAGPNQANTLTKPQAQKLAEQHRKDFNESNFNIIKTPQGNRYTPLFQT